MNLLDILALFTAMTALAALPSASVALVVTRAAALGTSHGVAVALGIVLGDLLFVAMAMLGLATVAEMLGELFVLVRLAAAGYLIWFGLHLIRTSGRATATPPSPSRRGLTGSLAMGLLLTLGDIKAIFFYASLLPAFVDLTALSLTDTFIIVAVTILAVGGVKLIYVLAARRAANLAQSPALRQRAGQAAGVMMIGLGGYLVTRP